MTKPDTIYCFIDTDVLIHFQTFDEVDWLSAISAKTVCLVLGATVMAEINDLKDRATDWRGKRARKIVSKLRAKLKDVDPGQPVEIRSGVFLMDIPTEPVVDWSEQGLDPNVNDDRLLATMIGFAAEHSSSEIVFLSNDFSALRKARRCGIVGVDPEEKQIQRLVRPTREEAEIETLRRRVVELEARIPELKLAFGEGGSETDMITRHVEASELQVQSLEEIGEIVDKTRERLERLLQQAGTMGPLQAEAEEFARTYGAYIKTLEPALILKRTRDLGRSCHLAFVLSNSGSAPATDVELSLEFPPGSFVLAASDIGSIWDEVWVPEEPKPKWQRTSPSLPGLTGAFDAIRLPQSLIANQPPPQPRPRGPLFSKDIYERSIVWYESPKVRSMDSWYLKPVVAYLPPEIGYGFQIRYTIRADELAGRIEGYLNVRLQGR